MGMSHGQFDKRLRKIVKSHQRMANGVAYRVDGNGLITAKPRVYNPKFPLRGLILLVGAAFLFKGYIYATLGAETYGERVSGLSQGALIEKAGGWIMQADPATLAVAEVLTSLGL